LPRHQTRTRFVEQTGLPVFVVIPGACLRVLLGSKRLSSSKGQTRRKAGAQSYGPSLIRMVARLPKGWAGEEPVRPRASRESRQIIDACIRSEDRNRPVTRWLAPLRPLHSADSPTHLLFKQSTHFTINSSIANNGNIPLKDREQSHSPVRGSIHAVHYSRPGPQICV